MRTRSTVLVALSILVLAVTAAGQPPFGGGPPGAGFGSFEMLLLNPDVGKELKLAPDQPTKISEIVRSIRTKHKSELEELRNLEPERRAALMKTIGEETLKNLDKVLKPEQIKRLKQIRYQVQGLQAFSDAGVENELKLTAEEKEKIKTLSEDLMQEIRDTFQGLQGDFQGAMKRIRELRKESMDKALAILTEEQRKTWKEMIGAPFELKFNPQLGRRPGRAPARD